MLSFPRDLFLKSLLLKKKKKANSLNIFLCWLVSNVAAQFGGISTQDGSCLFRSGWHPHTQNCGSGPGPDISERDPGIVPSNARDFGCCRGHSFCSMICLCNWKFQNMPEAVMPFPEGFFRDFSF